MAMKKWLKGLALTIIFVLLTSFIVFPQEVHGKNNEKYLVAVKTANGQYFCAENGGGDMVNATRDKIGDWETFEVIALNRGYIALKSNNGDYVRVSKDGKNVYADSDKIGNRETFQLIGLKNNKIALKTYDKKYICAEDGGGGKLVANREKIGSWETFELKKVEENTSDKFELTAKADWNSVTFTWTKPADYKNIVEYNLYRGIASGKQSNTPITDFPIEGTSYTDYNIDKNITYFYVLRPVYRDKTLGDVSNEVSVRLGSRTTTIVLEVGSKRMYINGQREEIDPGKGTVMIIKNGRTFLPIRAVIEAMGGEVEWRQSDKRVSIYLDKNEIHLWIGSKIAKVNGKSRETDVSPYISDSGRTMLPLRFIAENLDCEVDWDGLTKKVTIFIGK